MAVEVVGMLLGHQSIVSSLHGVCRIGLCRVVHGSIW